MENLNTLDLGIIALISVSAIFGIMRGFVREAMSLVTWISALFVATLYCTTVANHLTVISLLSLRYLIAFLLLVLVVLMVGGLISHWVSRLITLTGFSLTDRVVGTLFGTGRGVLIVAIALLITQNAAFTRQNALFKGSVLIPQLTPLATWIQKSLPEDLMNKLLNASGSASPASSKKLSHDTSISIDSSLLEQLRVSQ